jgi:phosphatidylinositol 4-kinase type 2
MRVTSSELRRGDTAMRPSIDEVDIASSAPSKHVPIDDLLGFASAPAEMPHPGRFEIATPTDDAAVSPNETAMSSSGILGGTSAASQAQGDRQAEQHQASAKGPSTSSARALNMYEPGRQQQPNASNRHQRRYSYATPGAQRRGGTGSIAQQLHSAGSGDIRHENYGDDLEGDLGYAAAEGQMGLQRKVIVERLETVKSNPVFTWC